MADVALVRFLARVDAQVALQLEGIWAGVRAMGALEWSLSGVAPHVTFQFAQLDALIVALSTSVRLLVCVTIANVTHQFARRGKGGVTKLAVVWLRPRVSINVILKRR